MTVLQTCSSDPPISLLMTLGSPVSYLLFKVKIICVSLSDGQIVFFFFFFLPPNNVYPFTVCGSVCKEYMLSYPRFEHLRKISKILWGKGTNNTGKSRLVIPWAWKKVFIKRYLSSQRHLPGRRNFLLPEWRVVVSLLAVVCVCWGKNLSKGRVSFRG